MFENLENKTVVSLGGYEYFRTNSKRLEKNVKIDYLCADPKYVKVKGYQFISEEEIPGLYNPYIVISLANPDDVKEAAGWCKTHCIPYTHLSFLTGNNIYDGKYLRTFAEPYTDSNGNTIYVSPESEGNIFINTSEARFSSVYIGAVNIRERLDIAMYGDNGKFTAGNGTSMLSVAVTVNRDGCIEIGNDCMFSHSVALAQSDMHMIFDKNTGRRINYPKPIKIGNHVWVGREAEILGGADIGDNSIVGARCVTAGQFPSNVIIAGCPGKIIREDIVWASDLIKNASYDEIRQCKDQNAFKYL